MGLRPALASQESSSDAHGALLPLHGTTPVSVPIMGQFRVSTWLDYSTQLSNQTLFEVLRSDFVAVVHIYPQLTSSKEVTFHNVGGPHPIS